MLLDRYLYRLFSRNLVLVLSALVGIYLLVDFFERIDNFMEKKLPFALALRYFACKTPLMLEQLMPVAVMLAAILTVGLLNHHRELNTLLATGIPLRRVIRPVLIGAVAATLFTVTMAQWVVPATMATVNRIWFTQVNSQYPTGILRAGTVFYRGAEGIYALTPDGEGRYAPFSYTAWDKDYRFQRQLIAAAAQRQDNGWLLADGQEKLPGEDGTPIITLFSERLVTLPESPQSLFIPKYQESERSFTDLWEGSFSGRWDRRIKARQQLHSRLSYIFLGIPLLLIGIPTLLSISRRWGKDLSLAIPAGCALAFVAWGGWGTLQSLANIGYFHYFPAAWLIHFGVGSGGIYFLRRLQ